jgi:protoheme IX farnesyltransferase
MNMRALYRLTKPGVTYGNLITTVAGYLFAANGSIDLQVFSALTIGTWGVIASACVINNYLDQDIDAVMTRTKKRPLLTGEVTPKQAVIFGALLGLGGTAVLSVFTNYWVAGIGVLGWIVYVWLYGALGKRKSVHGTLVGAVSGAVPIWAGWLAVYPGVDAVGVLLFLVIFFWQMPEFYAISIFREKEYAEANVPVSSVVRGAKVTARQIIIYTVLTVVCTLALVVSPLTSWTMMVVLIVTCLWWIAIVLPGLSAKNLAAWARKEFHFALIFLVIFCVVLSLNPYLP